WIEGLKRNEPFICVGLSNPAISESIGSSPKMERTPCWIPECADVYAEAAQQVFGVKLHAAAAGVSAQTVFQISRLTIKHCADVIGKADTRKGEPAGTCRRHGHIGCERLIGALCHAVQIKTHRSEVVVRLRQVEHAAIQSQLASHGAGTGHEHSPWAVEMIGCPGRSDRPRGEQRRRRWRNAK